MKQGFKSLEGNSSFRREILCLGLAFCLAGGMVGGLAGCGGTPAPGGVQGGCYTPLPLLWPGQAKPVAERPDCDPLPGSALPGGSFVFTLMDSVSPGHAPVPHNEAERLVFGHLYETLVQVDCQGKPQPGLAEHWTCTEDSTIWVFTLRDQARFWDGAQVTAAAVQQAWLTNRAAGNARDAVSLWSWMRPTSETITVLDARRLAVHLPEPQARFPLLLAHPATAVAASQPGWTWPVGSGPCRLLASTPPPLPEIACLPNQHYREPPAWKELVFLVKPGLDPRELALNGTDLAIVRDQQAARFLDAVPELRAIALPWDRLYLLICPPQTNPTGPGIWWDAAGSLTIPQDITAVSTRTWPHLVLPGGGLLACPQLTGPALLESGALLDWELAQVGIDDLTLLYEASDPGARELAQRLVALAKVHVRCAGLSGSGLFYALQYQKPGAGILTLKQNFASSCLQMASLLGHAAWLQNAVFGPDELGLSGNLADADRLAEFVPRSPGEALFEQGLARPLAVTRPWLVVRGELAGLKLAYDGTPILTGLGSPANESQLP